MLMQIHLGEKEERSQKKKIGWVWLSKSLWAAKVHSHTAYSPSPCEGELMVCCGEEGMWEVKEI